MTALPLVKRKGEERPSDPATLIDMLLKHEERIQDIESGMDKLNTLTKDTNHHLANMRISLKMLKPITEAVEKIEECVADSEKQFNMQKVKTDTSIQHMQKSIDSIGPWIKWGVGIGFSVVGLFMTVMTALKLWGV